MTKAKCPNCSSSFSKDSIFCEFCGAKVKLNKQEKEQQKLELQRIREEKRQQKIDKLVEIFNEARQDNLNAFRQNADIIQGVRILATNCCENCQKYNGVTFSLENVPALPVEKCTNDYCRCTYASVLKGLR